MKVYARQPHNIQAMAQWHAIHAMACAREAVLGELPLPLRVRWLDVNVRVAQLLAGAHLLLEHRHDAAVVLLLLLDLPKPHLMRAR